MPYGNPVDPVAGTVITVAYARTNILDPIRWLRLLTGNADPPGSSYVIVSGGTASASWAKVSSDVVADGSISDAKLTNPKVNRVGDTMTGFLQFASVGLGVVFGRGGQIRDEEGSTTVYANNNVFIAATENGSSQMLSVNPTQLNITGGLRLPNGGELRDETNSTTILCNNNTISVRSEDGTTSLFSAHPTVFNVTGPVTFVNGGSIRDEANSTSVFCNNDTLRIASENGLTPILTANPSTFNHGSNTVITSANIGIQNVSHANTANTATSATSASSAVNANNAQLAATIADGAVSTPAKIANGIISSIHMHGAYLDGLSTTPSLRTLGGGGAQAAAGNHTHEGGSNIPAGLIAAWSQAAATIPSGWQRFTPADGRMLVGDGTTFGVGYTVGQTIGSSWSHAHTAADHTHSLGAAGVGGTIGGPTAVNGLAQAGGVNLPTETHGHSHALDVTGSTDGGAVTVGQSQWVIPSLVVIWIQKI
jgi:hypothetical protein